MEFVIIGGLALGEEITKNDRQSSHAHTSSQICDAGVPNKKSYCPKRIASSKIVSDLPTVAPEPISLLSASTIVRPTMTNNKDAITPTIEGKGHN